ncbi:MAG: TraR/DksA family transcriptional regulator [Gammaproteobacteria bacterium]|nr:TraR/DksA family transcriptional regulator [Gammaproteobacteria bacterium]NIR30172.1 TraR/DksA family transcriptional regulator [Gammaproteobacteria bacterium]NIR98098.1 TraR/DksA family transcriptional regulator [Gammaproteobacteria bacterium]NIT63788.1 TraR/DksA family transcriptional regulator [Gammaproteobacteria bacterium]NIV20739.1 TraR/DksA family transcriptional regulator [Gammaproteobacteria bacterium]
MVSALSQDQTAQFQRRLKTRREELLEAIQQELVESDSERYLDLAGRVRDAGEDSVADLLSDLDIAEVDRHIQELREVEDALQRIAMGTYGVCADCTEPIEISRLEAYPTARRCYDDQKRFEETHAGTGRPTL